MLLQRTFKKNYAESLLDSVRNGRDLEKYANDCFIYDTDQVVMIPGIEFPDGLVDKMIPTSQGDCDSAIALFEAYPNLTPLQAADKSFWTYLTHVDLFKYVQERFPKVKEPGFNNITYVVDHWFCGPEWYWRHPLASLWWFVYQTIDGTNQDDKYKYTRFFFSNFEFRTNLAKYSLARLKEALFGYFDFLMDHPEIMSQYFKPRNRFLTKHLNKLGGTRLLSMLPRQTFYDELCSIKDEALAINSDSKKDKEEEENEVKLFE